METGAKVMVSHSKAVILTYVYSGEAREHLSLKHAAEGLNTSSITRTRYIKKRINFNTYILLMYHLVPSAKNNK